MKTRKAIKHEQLLAAQEKEEVIINALKFSRKRFKKLDEIILQLYLEKDLSSYFCDRRIWKINECFSGKPVKGEERAVLKNVFLYLYRYSSVMSGEDYIQAVFNMFKLRKQWIKDIFCWEPVSKRGVSQVHELALYLFCQYKVPEFLYKAFYEKDKSEYILWFIHIGTGKKARELPNMPLPFTQKMAHYFLQAPAVFNISEALRWAQVKGMNGDNRLAERIAYSWIGSKPYEQEFLGSIYTNSDQWGNV